MSEKEIKNIAHYVALELIMKRLNIYLESQLKFYMNTKKVEISNADQNKIMDLAKKDLKVLL